MPDKLSKLQSYSLNKTAGDVKLIKLKDTYKKRANIDERISRIKRDQDIPLTGRANELSELRRIYFTQKKKLTALKDLKKTHITNNSEEPPVVAGIRGEAGIGKTRLVNEFLKPHPKNYVAGISDNSVMSPYSLFISMIKKYGDISNSDPKDMIKNKLKFILQDLSNYEKNKTGKRNLLGTYNLLCYLLGVTQQKDHRLKLPAAELKIHLQLAIRIFIEAAASKVNYTGEPFIIVCEDIHWIDDSSASAISYILNTLNIGSGKDAIPKIIMFLFLYRPEFKVMKEAEQKSEFTEIRLEALDYNSVQKIINSKTGKGKNAIITDPIPEATVKKLAERSEGNPLFIQEWMKMFGDKYTREELINIKKHKLKFERSDIEIPDSINLLIEKRLNRLTESEMQILQYASVTGNEFSDVLLKGMAELLSNNSRIDEIINSLIESNFIQASEKVFGNEKYYRFHHDVIRKVVYDSIPDSSKKILHKTAGEVIQDLFSEKIEQYYYVLCDHFEKGGAEEKTIEYLEKAGDKARESFENERALGYYERLLNYNLESSLLVNIYLKKFTLMKHIGKWDEAVEFYNEFALNINAGIYPEEMPSIKFALAELLYNQGSYSNSIILLKKILRLKNLRQDELLFSRIHGLIGKNYLDLGKTNVAFNFLEIFYSESLKIKNDEGIAKANEYLGFYYKMIGNFSESLSYQEKSMKIYQKLGNILNINNLYSNMGSLYFYINDYQKSIFYLKKAIDVNLKSGNLNTYSVALGNLGITYTALGKYEESKNLFFKKLDISKKLSNKEGIASALSSIASIYIYEGKYAEAMDYCNKSLDMYTEIKKLSSIANCKFNIGLINYYIGNYGTALKYYKEQAEIYVKLCNKEGLHRSYTNLGNLYKKLQNYITAKEYYIKSIDIANQTRAIRMKMISLFNYSEYLFDTKEYTEALITNNSSLEICEKNSFQDELPDIKLLNQKIKFYMNIEKFNLDFKNNINNFVVMKEIIGSTEKLLQHVSLEHHIASLNYEIWKMKRHFKEFYRTELISNRNTALKIFKRISKLTPNFEYHSIINELKNEK